MMTREQLQHFTDGAIYAFDSLLLISEDKMLTWSLGDYRASFELQFIWVDYYRVEDEEPVYASDSLILTGDEKPEKMMKDIYDILYRINKTEVSTKSRKEALADAYSD